MTSLRFYCAMLCCCLANATFAVSWQSCPSPHDYDDSPPKRITRPGSGLAAYAAMGSRTARTSTTLSGDYRPFDLLSWTASPSACTATSTSDAPCGAHRVYVPSSDSPVREPLVVFLPGSSMTPKDHDLVLKTSAYAGYRTIGLSYDSTNNVDALCTFGGFHLACGINDCYAPKRDEIILGSDLSPAIHIEPADSVLERLFTLLAVLYADDISDGTNDHGWDAYFSPTLTVPVPIRVSNIAWDKIIIAGFSQGAGHAARISKEFLVHGTIMIDGPGDMCYSNWPPELVVAQWMDGPDASAGQPRFGALHEAWIDVFDLDQGAVPPTWAAMDIGANGLVSVDPTPTNSGHSNIDPFADPFSSDPIDIDFDRWLPPAEAMSTNQTPAGTTGSVPDCPDIPSLALPAGTSQKHGSMAADSCMPTTFNDGVLATQPSETYLFKHYLKRFCYACERSVCP